MTKIKWIDRNLINSYTTIGLCLDEASFHHQMKRLKVPLEEWVKWNADDANGTTHFFACTNPMGFCCIVCVSKKGLNRLELYGVLVHEAVHVWQSIRDHIGESKPSPEFEAYSIQSIAQKLMVAYNDNKGNKKTKVV